MFKQLKGKLASHPWIIPIILIAFYFVAQFMQKPAIIIGIVSFAGIIFSLFVIVFGIHSMGLFGGKVGDGEYPLADKIHNSLAKNTYGKILIVASEILAVAYILIILFGGVPFKTN